MKKEEIHVLPVWFVEIISGTFGVERDVESVCSSKKEDKC
jgi:hypothetical protein